MLEDDVQEEEEEEVVEVAVEREFNALLSAVKEVSRAVRLFSPSSGVVMVGDEEAEVVTDAVVIPIKVVVTTVSIKGDESAVSAV